MAAGEVTGERTAAEAAPGEDAAARWEQAIPARRRRMRRETVQGFVGSRGWGKER